MTSDTSVSLIFTNDNLFANEMKQNKTNFESNKNDVKIEIYRRKNRFTFPFCASWNQNLSSHMSMLPKYRMTKENMKQTRKHEKPIFLLFDHAIPTSRRTFLFLFPFASVFGIAMTAQTCELLSIFIFFLWLFFYRRWKSVFSGGCHVDRIDKNKFRTHWNWYKMYS